MVLVSISRGSVSAAGRRRHRRGGVYTGVPLHLRSGMMHAMGRRRRHHGANRFTDFFTKTIPSGFKKAAEGVKDAFTKPVHLSGPAKTILNGLRDYVNPFIAKTFPTILSKLPIPGARALGDAFDKVSQGYLKVMPPKSGLFASGRRRLHKRGGWAEYGGVHAMGGLRRQRRGGLRAVGGLRSERGRQRGGIRIFAPNINLPKIGQYLKRGKEIYDKVRPGVEVAIDIAKLIHGKGRRRVSGCGTVQGSARHRPYRRLRLSRPRRGRGLIPVGSGARSAWIDKVRSYAQVHHVPYKQALIACKGH